MIVYDHHNTRYTTKLYSYFIECTALKLFQLSVNMVIYNVDGLVQDHSKSSALVMELLQFCT